jgi:hypothetical protein
MVRDSARPLSWGLGPERCRSAPRGGPIRATFGAAPYHPAPVTAAARPVGRPNIGTLREGDEADTLALEEWHRMNDAPATADVSAGNGSAPAVALATGDEASAERSPSRTSEALEPGPGPVDAGDVAALALELLEAGATVYLERAGWHLTARLTPTS